MFEAEAAGLAALRETGEIRVPDVLDCGSSDGESYIVLEFLDLEPASADAPGCLGRQLARLHRHAADRFGWHRDNTIGPTPQINTWHDDWAAFFRQHRLDYQVQLARANGYDLSHSGKRLGRSLGRLFDNYEPVPSLLHGDLWGGNWGAVDGDPVIFDPAVYYGDRETDIAMTLLFGGFGARFYEAYTAEWPLAAGHEDRIKLYQLYHVLNHLNLFGGSYLGRAERLLAELLQAE
jgi:fructosamine-3-kinase